ncbi:penicillin-binding protein activator [Halomonas llamarensis]|uniref:Penicillin-binding protein activator n=1 Tax=Halomonas llamarensis TaxID=2945104 RepID=A0ABT0SM58_9GAMM|nr:penicillin-binding protein activator [Halomonas llamarensis]MCL7928883.1 penicillin-binding protein activator [Halomonas llamarensis]
MKPLYRGLLTLTLTALFMAGCAVQQPLGVVDRVPDQDPNRLLSQAQEQTPAQAAQTRLEAANIYARQGQRNKAFVTADELDPQKLSEPDRVRWALLYSGLARALDEPRAVLKAATVLNQELGMSAEQQQTLQERRRWAQDAVDQLDPERFSLPEFSADVKRIAVYLPESGPLDNVASVIATAMRQHHDVQNSDVQLHFIDASRHSLDALYDRAEQMGAQIVIGPLDKNQVTALEQRQSVPLPTLALNYGKSRNNQATRLFQFGLSAEDEARQAAQRAWQDGHRQMVIMVPDNDWGRRVGEAFWNEWSAQGGDVANAVRYNPKSSVSNSVKTALNVRGERAQLNNIDALFLLAVPDYARQIPPTLDYYYAPNLPIYATSHLHDGQHQPRLDQDLDDVMFMDIPWQIPDAAVGGEEVLPFYTTYRTMREEGDASMFSLMAMGVDAFEIATNLTVLTGAESLNGATGRLYLTADGRIYRELPWAKFQNGTPAPILIPGLSTPDEE